MRIGIIGGGVLGLTLAYRLAKDHRVELFEGNEALGGLAAAHDYGSFVWDRFYHCILPQDRSLLALLGELGLESELRWTKTGTGYYSGGRSYSMSGSADFLRFPLISPLDRVRLGATILYATRVADPWKLYGVSAQDWLVAFCGRRTYEVFWRPLLRAKFGPFYDRIAAVFIWATLTRLFGARSATTAKEKLGYVSGGYRRILQRFDEALLQRGAEVRTRARVSAIRPALGGKRGERTGCELEYQDGTSLRSAHFDQVFFTGPTGLARSVASGAFLGHVEDTERAYPGAEAYLGVACLVLVLKRALTPFYVLNIGEDSELTGLIEMTNLIDRSVETNGLHLAYLPKYLDSNDERLSQPDALLEDALLDRGLRRIFPDLKNDDIVHRCINRTKYVQPLPLVRSLDGVRPGAMPPLSRPFQILNTSMLACATLNNNEVVGLVDRYVQTHALA